VSQAPQGGPSVVASDSRNLHSSCGLDSPRRMEHGERVADFAVDARVVEISSCAAAWRERAQLGTAAAAQSLALVLLPAVAEWDALHDSEEGAAFCYEANQEMKHGGVLLLLPPYHHWEAWDDGVRVPQEQSLEDDAASDNAPLCRDDEVVVVVDDPFPRLPEEQEEEVSVHQPRLRCLQDKVLSSETCCVGGTA